MLRLSRRCCRSRTYEAKLRRKFRDKGRVPMKQTFKQREDNLTEIMKYRRAGSDLSYQERMKHLERGVYSSGARADRQGMAVNRTYALQGLGDLEPLRGSTSFGISEATTMKYDNLNDMAKHEAPPVPFTPLAARKLAEGKFWPTAPEPENLASKEVMKLRHEKNMSPSAITYCTHVEYYLRRDLKSCPAHIGEAIDFAQLIIKEVLASRRSKKMYIVWSTVHPGARYELEPHVLRLSEWVRRMIMRRIKIRPNIPSITWIYDAGSIGRELPHELKNKLEALMVDNSTTLEDRVKYLKSMDTLQAKMKGIPWFMPYLWSKDKKLTQRKEMMADVAEVERRGGGGGGKTQPAPYGGDQKGTKKKVATVNASSTGRDPKPSFVV